ncbi:MAG: hypothetical protein DME83_04140 [Verrucomicrobia bacterium]|nr:MAG: hypothetical protein DME83_04140 [Verrucomicrobiota bacterium]
MKREYDLAVLRVTELPSIEMRKLVCGNYRAKLAALWEGPFEFYVWLDSDAIVWGDFTPHVRTDVDFQIFWSEISAPPDASEIPPWLPHFHFDPQKLRNFDAEFDWRGKAYFSSGAFACRRSAIPFDRWAKVESWAKQAPGLFAWGEMGTLNYIVHAMSQRGEIKTAMSNLQHVWGHHGKEELMKDCVGTGWHFPKEIHRPRVAHFCGRKPLLIDRKAYSRPFTIARLEHHRRHHGDLGAWLAVLNEDRRVLVDKVKRRLRNLVGR